VPHFNGLDIVSTMKEIKRRFFFLPSTKEATKKSTLKYIHSLVYYFTWFNLNEKFNAYSTLLKCILEWRKGRNMEREFRILLFGSSSSNVYCHAVPCKFRVCKNV